MIDIFRDLVYEELDFISQATKPAVSKRLAIRGELTDEAIELTVEQAIVINLDGLFANNLINKIYGLDSTLSTKHLDQADFDIVMSDGVTINVTKNTMNGSITIQKKPLTDEHILQSYLSKSNIVSSIRYDVPNKDLKRRVKKLLSLLGEDKPKTNSMSKLTHTHLIPCLKKLWFNKDTQIRDYDLFTKIANWTVDYARHGEEASYVNLSRLKTMTTLSNNPIYSIQEV